MIKVNNNQHSITKFMFGEKKSTKELVEEDKVNLKNSEKTDSDKNGKKSEIISKIGLKNRVDNLEQGKSQTKFDESFLFEAEYEQMKIKAFYLNETEIRKKQEIQKNDKYQEIKGSEKTSTKIPYKNEKKDQLEKVSNNYTEKNILTNKEENLEEKGSLSNQKKLKPELNQEKNNSTENNIQESERFHSSKKSNKSINNFGIKINKNRDNLMTSLQKGQKLNLKFNSQIATKKSSKTNNKKYSNTVKTLNAPLINGNQLKDNVVGEFKMNVAKEFQSDSEFDLTQNNSNLKINEPREKEINSKIIPGSISKERSELENSDLRNSRIEEKEQKEGNKGRIYQEKLQTDINSKNSLKIRKNLVKIASSKLKANINNKKGFFLLKKKNIKGLEQPRVKKQSKAFELEKSNPKKTNSVSAQCKQPENFDEIQFLEKALISSEVEKLKLRNSLFTLENNINEIKVQLNSLKFKKKIRGHSFDLNTHKKFILEISEKRKNLENKKILRIQTQIQNSIKLKHSFQFQEKVNKDKILIEKKKRILQKIKEIKINASKRNEKNKIANKVIVDLLNSQNNYILNYTSRSRNKYDEKEN